LTSYDRIPFETTQCGKERPDFLWDLNSYYVILEVDEYQHQDRPCECEQTRMVNVTQGLGMSCLWVRYNPDEFRGQTVSLRDKHRLDYLIKYLRHHAFVSPPTSSTDMLRVVHLFFDGFDMQAEPAIHTIPTI
jgi:hypothetical protein